MKAVETESRRKCVRSFRIAQLLMERGHVPLGIEYSRKSTGYKVFVFEKTPAFNAEFERIMREVAGEKDTTKGGSFRTLR